MSARTIGFLNSPFEIQHRITAMLGEFIYPSPIDLGKWHWVEVVVLFPAAPDHADQFGALQNTQVLAHRLPAYCHLVAQLPQGLPLFNKQAIKQSTSRFVCECLEDSVHNRKCSQMGA